MQTVDHSQKIIEIKDLYLSYGKEEILQNINLEIYRGDYLGIVGPNGSGKTSLIKVILGLLPPASGNIKLFGKDIKQFKDWSKIGYIAQKDPVFDKNFPATVKEVVLMGRYAYRGLFHFITAEDRSMVNKVLEQVGMLDNKDRLIGDLSGGQQQRVFIARALVGQPEVIFLDEPTVGIDKKSQTEFYSLLKKINTELNVTLVIVSHDIEVLIKEVVHIACINKSLVCHASPEEFVKESLSESLFGLDVKVIKHHDHNK